jgi:hypothetical protein
MKAPDAPGQLYDLEADPGETDNLYFKHPETVRELKSQLDAYVKSGRSAPLRREKSASLDGAAASGHAVTTRREG